MDSSSDNDSESNAAQIRRRTRYEIECDPQLPHEWKEIEEEESDTALILFKQLGSLAVLIYKRVNALGVIQDEKNSK